jgi:16S rRNA (cytosine967-C5)-methyltransferase
MRVERTDAYASGLLHSQRLVKLSTADHGLTTELVMGVLRWRSALDGVIAQSSPTAVAKLDFEVLTALRLGAYQLLALGRVPARAAVNESVEITKRARKRSAAGLVNAVLRKIASLEQRDKLLVARSAHPDWLVQRWSANYGIDIAHSICEYDQISPAASVRIADPNLKEELELDGIALERVNLLTKAFRVSAGEITATRAFRERRLNIQDEGSQLVALLVGKGYWILDACAAPGGKTRIMAERNPFAAIVAMDVHPQRAALLRKLVPNSNVHAIAADARLIPTAKKFDRVLVDAPCSGTGTLARNPEIKWRLKSEDVTRLQSNQLKILLSAMQFVASGGRVIYSTCSLEPEENEQVIEAALTQHASFTILDCRGELENLHTCGELATQDVNSLLSGQFLRTIPGVHGCDGFFAAILHRR